MNLKPAKFKIESLGSQLPFDGFTKGEEWNGWAVPYFSYEQASKVMDVFVKSNSLNGKYSTAFYDSDKDAFFFVFDDSKEEMQEFPAETIGDGKYYLIGSSDWIWEEINDDF